MHAFLFDQMRNRDVVRDVLVEGEGNFYVIAANLIISEYKRRFGEPLPPESDESFKQRRKNAKGERKTEVHKKPGETAEEAEARVEGRVQVSYYAAFLNHPPSRHLRVGYQGVAQVQLESREGEARYPSTSDALSAQASTPGSSRRFHEE